MNTDVEFPALTAFDIISSCSVCFRTLADVYGQLPSLETLSDGQTRVERGAIRVWLAECAHITCASHLKDGGVPFHSYNDVPKAPCPVCTAEAGDTAPKKLFPLYEKARDQRDEHIPVQWFETPPSSLGGDKASTGLQAAKFQWQQLVRYGLAVTRELHHVRREEQRLQVLRDDFHNLKQTVGKERSQLAEATAKSQHAEAKLAQWQAREPQILARLEVFEQLLDENGKLWTALGGFLDSKLEKPDWKQRVEDAEMRLKNKIGAQKSERTSQDITSSRVKPSPLSPSPRMSTTSAASPRKRTFSEMSLPESVNDRAVEHEARSSRDAMPPPPLPLSVPSVQIFNDGRWQGSNTPSRRAPQMIQRDDATSQNHRIVHGMATPRASSSSNPKGFPLPRISQSLQVPLPVTPSAQSRRSMAMQQEVVSSPFFGKRTSSLQASTPSSRCHEEHGQTSPRQTVQNRTSAPLLLRPFSTHRAGLGTTHFVPQQKFTPRSHASYGLRGSTMQRLPTGLQDMMSRVTHNYEHIDSRGLVRRTDVADPHSHGTVHPLPPKVARTHFIQPAPSRNGFAREAIVTPSPYRAGASDGGRGAILAANPVRQDGYLDAARSFSGTGSGYRQVVRPGRSTSSAIGAINEPRRVRR